MFEGDPSALLGLSSEEFAKQLEEMNNQNNSDQNQGLFEKMINDSEVL